MPERVGRYDIVLQIARGGMASVYLARAEGHGGFDRYVALKLTAEHLRDDPEFAEHLVEEAKLVAHLRHQNVVPVLDVGEHDQGAAVFLVMDYVPGDSLGGLFKLARAKNETIDPRIGLRVLIDALAGLHAAHEHRDEEGRPLNVVHRDFSPQNILVGTDGIARLTDFGIAKAASRASMTLAGTMKGKVSYASPEQARGTTLDRRSDIWAGGVIAWEIFAGRKMFPSHERTLLEVVKGPPPRIRSVVPTVPQEIDAIIAQALAFDASARTPTAKHLARSLEDASRRHGLLADVDEVAEYVQRLVAPTLAERKRAISLARGRRMGPTGSQSDITVADPLPSLPEMPETTVSMAVAPTPSAPRIAASPSYDDAMVTPPVPFQPVFEHSGSTTPAGIETPPPMLPVNPNPFTRLMAKLAPLKEKLAPLDAKLAPLNAKLAPLTAKLPLKAQDFIAKKPAVAYGGAAGAVGLFFLLIIVIAASSSGPSAKELAAAASASASAVAMGTPPEPAMPTRTNAPAPSLGDPEPLPMQIEMTANVPVRTVSVGSRVVDMEVPAPTVSVELTPEEAGKPVALTATSVDGRSAKANWTPGDATVELAFGASAAARPSGGAKPAGGGGAGKSGGWKKHL